MNDSIRQYLERHGFGHFSPKAVLFDMDGVLYDSMPHHAIAWQESMKRFGIRRVNQQVQNYKTYLKNSHFGVEKFNFSLGLSFNFFCIDIILLSV